MHYKPMRAIEFSDDGLGPARISEDIHEIDKDLYDPKKVQKR